MPDERLGQRLCFLPERYSVLASVLRNSVTQLASTAADDNVEVGQYRSGNMVGTLVESSDGTPILVFPRNTQLPGNASYLLIHPGVPSAASQGRWAPPAGLQRLDDENLVSSAERCARVRESWRSQFTFKEEERNEAGEISSYGLRAPQIGALFAILAHWKVSKGVATIVMPTGTGKTETMLALVVYQRAEKVLVVVPTVALRDQIARKFITLGLLKQLGIVGADALYPVVAKLEHRPRTVEEVESVFKRANVVVANMQVLSGCSSQVRQAIADRCSHLLIDEAHHIGAPTWAEFRQYFAQKPTIQFTATPFRTDGKHVDGKIIFNYPLGLAQREGYFKPIQFREVWALENEDLEIALSAKQQLERDISDGLDHVIMARVGSISRAESVLQIYERELPEHAPVLIHSRLPARERREGLRKLKERETRVVVCVDMLGEGFDLPELKIAALHDVHKSLAITLQFTGRFTRVRDEKIGDATMIANVASTQVEAALRELYAENADWNMIIRRLGETAAGHQEQRSEFSDSFSSLPDDVPLQTILPKMSTVVFQTACDEWQPHRITEVVKKEELYTEPSISNRHKVVWFVTQETEAIPWADYKELKNTVWHLYLIHWDEERKLLFINSSNKDSVHEALAKSIASDSAALIRGTRVYRAMHGIKRFIPAIVGLKSGVDRNIQFMMLAGVNVDAGFNADGANNKIKSNVFGRGYEAGVKASIGCSMKGRIWSHLVAKDILAWTEWCRHIGDKLLNDDISLEEMFKGFLIPVRVTERPALVPLAIEWPAEFWQRSEESISVAIGEEGEAYQFFETSLDLTQNEREGPIGFQVGNESGSAEYRMEFSEDGIQYRPIGREAYVTVGKRRFPLSAWFRREHPQVYFEQDASLIGGEMIRLSSQGRDPFPAELIEAVDWTGINISRESQGTQKEPDSVQYRVIENLLKEDWDIIYDDDTSYEAADVIAIRLHADRIQIRLYHCKFSTGKRPGHRIDDLYVLCGQGQKSVRWREDIGRLVRHMVNRERSRRATGFSRFERGDLRSMADVIRKLPWLTPEFDVFLVQPGVSKQEISHDQLELLGSTRAYLKETLGISMKLLASA